MEHWGGEIIEAWGGIQTLLSLPLEEPVLWSSRTSGAQDPPSNDYLTAMVAAGFADALTLGLAREDTMLGSCIFGRTRKAGPFRAEELAFARLLLPHAQRAMAFSRMLELATLRAGAFEAALDAVAIPTVLVSGRSELVHAIAPQGRSLNGASCSGSPPARSPRPTCAMARDCRERSPRRANTAKLLLPRASM